MTSLILFFALICKHAIADLGMQSRHTLRGSKTDLRTPRLWLHCLDHAVLTFFVLILFTGFIPALIIALLEYAAHFAIDFTKNYLQNKNKVKLHSSRYWQYATIDQIAHYTTYFVIVLAM